MKTLLTLLLLIPSLSWGFFGKKYDCTFFKAHYLDGKVNTIEGKTNFKLEITMFEKEFKVHLGNGNINEYEIEKKNDAILISKSEKKDDYMYFLELDKISKKSPTDEDLYWGKFDFIEHNEFDYHRFYCKE